MGPHLTAKRDRTGTWGVSDRRRPRAFETLVDIALFLVVLVGAVSPFFHLALMLLG